MPPQPVPYLARMLPRHAGLPDLHGHTLSSG